MNFRPGNDKRRAVDYRIDVTNLVDIAFLLIIFFTMSTSFAPSVKNSPGINVDLPKASSKEIQTGQKTVVVVLTKEGLTLMNGKSMSQQEVEEKLKEFSQGSQDVLMIVQADRTVPHGRVVSMMDLAKALGINRLAIATEEK